MSKWKENSSEGKREDKGGKDSRGGKSKSYQGASRERCDRLQLLVQRGSRVCKGAERIQRSAGRRCPGSRMTESERE